MEEEIEARRNGEQQQRQDKQKQNHRSRDKKEAIRTERYRRNKNGRPRTGGNEGGSGRPTLLLSYCSLQLSLQSKIRNAPMVTPEGSWARASTRLGAD